MAFRVVTDVYRAALEKAEAEGDDIGAMYWLREINRCVQRRKEWWGEFEDDERS